jgi:hypothetical protein
MTATLTVRLSPGKLAKLNKRAAELGQDRSSYVRGLIEEDLLAAPKTARHTFASEDLVGCVSTGLSSGDNATVRDVIRQKLRANAKHR